MTTLTFSEHLCREAAHLHAKQQAQRDREARSRAYRETRGSVRLARITAQAEQRAMAKAERAEARERFKEETAYVRHQMSALPVKPGQSVFYSVVVPAGVSGWVSVCRAREAMRAARVAVRERTRYPEVRVYAQVGAALGACFTPSPDAPFVLL